MSKIEGLPDEIAAKMSDMYSHEKMPKHMALIGEGKYCMIENRFREEDARSLVVRPDDVWVGGFARAGTHWLGELTWLVANDLDYKRAAEIPYNQRVEYYDYGQPKEYFEGLPSPRFLNTHLPLSLLPPALLDRSKMAYVTRDPRDVILSCYYFFKNHTEVAFRGTLKEFLYLFMAGYTIYAPFFENVKEFWNKRNHPNILFLFYENMKQDLPGAIREVCKFFNKSYSDKQIEELSSHLQFSNLKKNRAVNNMDLLGDNKDQVVRNGISGGWRSEFDEQMIEDVNNWIKKNLRDTDLRFPHMDIDID